MHLEDPKEVYVHRVRTAWNAEVCDCFLPLVAVLDTSYVLLVVGEVHPTQLLLPCCGCTNGFCRRCVRLEP